MTFSGSLGKKTLKNLISSFARWAGSLVTFRPGQIPPDILIIPANFSSTIPVDASFATGILIPANFNRTMQVRAKL